MDLPRDILDRVAREFSRAEQGRAQAVLEAYHRDQPHPDCGRVLRGMLLLARGDLGELETLEAHARRDWRDVLFWAEYPEQSRLDTPEKIEAFNRMCERFGIALRAPLEGRGTR